jgi:hypothetical protein
VILDWPDLHEEATAIGLDVVMANWWSLATKPEQIESSIELAKKVDPARLVAVSMMDEPERYARDTPFSFYWQLYQNLRPHFDKELPGVQLEISHWGPLLSWTEEFYKAFVPLYQATDRIRLMPYPDLAEAPLNEVYYQMLRSRRIMELAGRDLPQVVILQTWVIPDEPKLPTIDELRVMAYTAILTGAHTVSFFNYDPEAWAKAEGFTEGFAELMKELTQFSSRYGAAEFESQMDAAGVLHSTIHLPDGTSTTVAVNTVRSNVGGYAALAVEVHEAPGMTVAARSGQGRGSVCLQSPRAGRNRFGGVRRLVQRRRFLRRR